MPPALKTEYISVANYLAAEEKSDLRHEYLGGLVYAMAGETRAHNEIVGNLYLALRRRLKGKPCQVYTSDIRVNFLLREDDYFYYPDLVVTCDKRDTHPRFIRHPKLILEVLSASTERVDRREKFFAYTGIESLEEYILVAQDRREATLFRRANGWKAEVVSGARASLPIKSLATRLPLTTIYEGV